MSASRRPLEEKPPRLGALARMPLFYALDGKRVVIAGGGAAAAWKVELLSAAGARVNVYADDTSDDMRAVARDCDDCVTLYHRAWTADDLRGAALAVGAFEDDSAAREFSQSARAFGVPVNVIDKPDFCDFSFGSIVNRSPMVIGISTDGAAPVFAQAIRAKLEALLPKGFSLWAEAARRWRPALRTSGLSFSARRKFWHLFAARAVTHPDKEPSQTDFDSFIVEVKGLGGGVGCGTVTLVGAGPGDPELLTLRAVRALQSADVILFDDLVSRDVLDFARREAKKLLVGKTGYGPSCKQDEINALMLNLAGQGKRVVRLKGGDPLIFGRAGEEIAACHAAGVTIDIVPGITAAQGAAARLGVSLTDRKHARRLQYVTGHGKDGALPKDFDWHSLVDAATTTAIYMPAKTLDALVQRAIAEGLDPQMPALAIARATRPDQAVIASTLFDLPERLAQANLPGPLLVMLGRVFEGRMQMPADRASAKH